MNLKKILESHLPQQISALLAIVLAVPIIIGWILKLLNLAHELPVSFIINNINSFFNVSIFFAILYLVLSHNRIVRRFNVSFVDKFKGDLNDNWEFTGDWTKVEKKTLCVKNSEIGGITKIGSLWENYAFEFETKIINNCSSWIIRAKDLNNYFMFQCRKDVIRPHLRLAVQSIQKEDKNHDSENEITVVSKVGWHIWDGVPHNANLENWVKVKIQVVGSSVKIWIDNNLVYHDSNKIPFSTGRVGFRNHSTEEAHFRNVKVKPLN